MKLRRRRSTEITLIVDLPSAFAPTRLASREEAAELRQPEPVQPTPTAVEPYALAALLRRIFWAEHGREDRWLDVAEAALRVTAREGEPLAEWEIALLDRADDERRCCGQDECFIETGCRPETSSGGEDSAAGTSWPTAADGHSPPDDTTDLALDVETALDELARALARQGIGHDLWATLPDAAQELYRRQAHVVALAGWRPPTTHAGDPE